MQAVKSKNVNVAPVIIMVLRAGFLLFSLLSNDSCFIVSHDSVLTGLREAGLLLVSLGASHVVSIRCQRRPESSGGSTGTPSCQGLARSPCAIKSSSSPCGFSYGSSGLLKVQL